MILSLLQNVNTDSGAHPASNRYPHSHPRVKQLGRKADHSRPPSAEVKSKWSYTSTPPVMPLWLGQ
jgi:hypothetical protein